MTSPTAAPRDDPPDGVAATNPASDTDLLVRCPDCGGSVGSRRRFCPDCWAELPRRRRAVPVAPVGEGGPGRPAAPEASTTGDDSQVVFPADDFDPGDWRVVGGVPPGAYPGDPPVPADLDQYPLAGVVDEPGRRWVAVPVAPPPRQSPGRRRNARRRPPRPSRLAPLFVGYAIMLGLTVVFGVASVVAAIRRGEVAEDEVNALTVVIEGLAAALVLGVAVVIGRLPVHRPGAGPRAGAWVGGFPVLAVLLALNFGFTALLRSLFRVEHVPGPGLTLATFFLVCVQPAVIEEWFFRHLALGSLRETVGAHGAVWISGAMFGVAHILNPIGIPYLILVGVCLGYLRVWSGGMALPVLLHFVHNLVVVVADGAI